MQNILKHVIVLLIVVLILGGIFYIMNYTSLLSASRLHVETVEMETAELQQGPIRNLELLNAIRFDTGYIDHPVYDSLHDMRVPLRKPELSREDPFAEL